MHSHPDSLFPLSLGGGGGGGDGSRPQIILKAKAGKKELKNEFLSKSKASKLDKYAPVTIPMKKK